MVFDELRCVEGLPVFAALLQVTLPPQANVALPASPMWI
jgi:hypothetical protein